MSQANIVVTDSDRAQSARIYRLANQMQFHCDVFATAEELFESSALEAAGVVVSEFRLLGMNGIDMQQKIRQHNQDTQVIFCTDFAETRLTVLAMQNGAFTVLEKNTSDHELLTCISMAMQRYEMNARQHVVTNQIRRSVHQLNGRQREVLQLMMDGLPNKQIAARLDVSVRTVESCRHDIFEMTITNSIAELVRLVTLADIEFDPKPDHE